MLKLCLKMMHKILFVPGLKLMYFYTKINGIHGLLINLFLYHSKILIKSKSEQVIILHDITLSQIVKKLNLNSKSNLYIQFSQMLEEH